MPERRRTPCQTAPATLAVSFARLQVPMLLLLFRWSRAKLDYDADFFSGHQAAKEHGVYELMAKHIIELALRHNVNQDKLSFLELGCGHGFLVSALQHELQADKWRNVFCLEGSAAAQNFWPRRFKSTYSHVDLNRLMHSSISYRKNRIPVTNMVISLEVAEHLLHPRGFVDLILTHAPELVVFGAATPGQGGHIHINEKPLSFWADLFEERGYSLLAEETTQMRNVFMQSNIFDSAPWYFKNLLLFSSQKEAVGVQISPKMSLMPFGCATALSVDGCDPALAKRDFWEWEMLLAKSRMKAAEQKCRKHGGCDALSASINLQYLLTSNCESLRVKLFAGPRIYILRVEIKRPFLSMIWLISAIREKILSRNDIAKKRESFLLVSKRASLLQSDEELLRLADFGRDRTELRVSLKLLLL